MYRFQLLYFQFTKNKKCFIFYYYYYISRYIAPKPIFMCRSITYFRAYLDQDIQNFRFGSCNIEIKVVKPSCEFE